MSSQECRLLHDGIVMASMSMCVPEREKGAEGPLVGWVFFFFFIETELFDKMRLLPR